MKFFIADGSKLGLRRLLMLLGDKKEFELVGYSADVTAAIISIQTVKPQVVILDLDMRGRNGIDVLKMIKHEMPDTIFIILTNAASEQYRRRCKELGAEYFFDKSTEFSLIPITLKKLAAQCEHESAKEKKK
ncbi:MAG: response regulator [Ignavibacteriales bacterium]|nr:response regulator [Ignavibacteriales bacterium]